MTVEIDNRQHLYDINEIKNTIEMVIQNILKYENVENECFVSVLLVSNEEMQEINKEYRGINDSTDVLSFPLIEYEKKSKSALHEAIENIDMDTGEIVLGDILISVEKAYEQSREYGHSIKREIAFLTLHGMLHLLGYDHMLEDDKKIMRQKEEKVLDILNINR